MNKTGIPYCDFTWNPTHGCTPTSPGCVNCWANGMAKRLAGMGARGYDPVEPFAVTCCDWKLDEPLRRKKGARIAVSFMGDLFHEDVPDEFIRRVFRVMAQCPQHTFQVLTKRTKHMRLIGLDWPRNVWAGVTVESNTWTHRIAQLMCVQASVRFASIEPILGPVLALTCRELDWAIVGCESGPGRRRYHKNDYVSIPINTCIFDTVAQLDIYGVPVFVKQIEIGGRVVKCPKPGEDWHPDWPETLRRMEMPRQNGRV